jgi:hypothetical protein
MKEDNMGRECIMQRREFVKGSGGEGRRKETTRKS